MTVLPASAFQLAPGPARMRMSADEGAARLIEAFCTKPGLSVAVPPGSKVRPRSRRAHP
jgi:hypothetical protein